MRRTFVPAVTAGAIMLVASATSAVAQDQSRAVSGGGISVAGWAGKIDANEASRGGKLEDAKLVKEGNNLHVTTGPAVAYWNPANKASGNYTVKATFTESKFMGLNDHAHPYGVFIGGNDLGTDQQTYLYCAAYGNGRFIVRGFGPAAFQLNGRMGETNDAVHKAANKGEPVTQEIALSVKGDEVTCSVNGTVVGTYKKADVVGAGKVKSLDGVYGIRFGHNTEATVSGLAMTKN
jgi:pectate lyase